MASIRINYLTFFQLEQAERTRITSFSGRTKPIILEDGEYEVHEDDGEITWAIVTHDQWGYLNVDRFDAAEKAVRDDAFMEMARLDTIMGFEFEPDEENE